MKSLYLGLLFAIICVIKGNLVSANCPCKSASLCEPVTEKYNKDLAVFGGGDNGNWKKWNWTEITNVILISMANFSDIYCFAHEHNVRVTILVGAGDFHKLPDPQFRQQIISSWIDKIKTYNLDGINMDIEGPAATKEVVDGISALTHEAHTAIKTINPNYIVTFDVYYSPFLADCISFLCYNYTAIASATDYMIAMDYDASLDLVLAYSNSPLDLLAQSYNQYINELGIPAQHLVMAVPWYGYNYTCSKFYNESGGDVCVIADAPKSQSNFANIMESYHNNIDGLKYLAKAKTPYFTTKINGIYHQYHFDNTESLTYKFQLAQQLGLRGLTMWNAGCLNYESTDQGIQKQTRDMWNTITEYFQLLKAK